MQKVTPIFRFADGRRFFADVVECCRRIVVDQMWKMLRQTMWCRQNKSRFSTVTVLHLRLQNIIECLHVFVMARMQQLADITHNNILLISTRQIILS